MPIIINGEIMSKTTFHLFRDEQYIEGLKESTKLPKRKSFEDYDIDLLPLYHSHSRIPALYRFFNGTTLLRETNPLDYLSFKEHFSILPKDEMLDERLEGRLPRYRLSAHLELVCQAGGKVCIRPDPIMAEMPRNREEAIATDREDLMSLEEFEAIANNPLFENLLVSFFVRSGIDIEPGHAYPIFISMVRHKECSEGNLPIHKDFGMDVVGLTMIDSKGLVGGENTLYLTADKIEELGTSPIEDTEYRFRRSPLRSVAQTQLQSPLDMLVFENNACFHDVRAISSCERRDLIMFGITRGNRKRLSTPKCRV